MNSVFCFVIILLVSSVHCQQYDDYQQQQQEAAQGGYQDQNVQENENAAGGENAVDNSGPLDPSVPEPPSQIPETSFVCDGKPYDPGMYADEETGCRVYHMCYRGKKESFICGTGTVFNQEILSCDYPDKVDCSASSSFYDANSELGKSSPEPSNQGGNQGNQGASGRPRPATGQSPELGGSDVDQQTNQGGDYQPPRGAARPRTPVARPPPSAPRPSQSFESSAGGSSGDQPNLRPNAPVPRPRAKTNNLPRPSTNYRPAAGGSSLDRPVSRPSNGKTNRARPAAPADVRPVVQANDDQILDYEPSQIIQRRVNRQSYTRQQVPRERAFQRRSARWQVMSATY